jgi:glycine dehydrogenase subunit 1
MGGGAYDHFTPTIVQSVLERPEFKTAYTPYQAEVSQGTLQSMYEFQSMICALTGMDVANASLYDGGSALAEACLMAHNQNRKHKIMLAGTINPFYRQVVDTICTAKDLEFHTFIAEDGSADLEALKNAIDDDTSAVVVQQPNAYGSLEDVEEIEKIVHSTKALYIVSVDPVSLGLITPPGDYGADVVVGEGQPLGIPMNFGGPYLGLFACRKKYVRKVPGRLSGVTEDIDGNRGFVLTLQTREQQIKRERATSNICTNQGLIMLAATVYMAAMGKQGLSEVAEQSFRRAHYLAEKIKEIIDKMAEKGILAGIDTSRFEDCMEGLLVAVTEKRTREEMDRFAEELKQFSK